MIRGIMPNKLGEIEEGRRGIFWQHLINIWGSGDVIRFDGWNEKIRERKKRSAPFIEAFPLVITSVYI